jgi:hypothetical protein
MHSSIFRYLPQRVADGSSMKTIQPLLLILRRGLPTGNADPGSATCLARAGARDSGLVLQNHRGRVLR